MADKSQEIEAVSGKTIRNKDGKITDLIEWATDSASTPEEIMDMFLEQDVPFTHGEELTGDYKVVHSDAKTEWCSKHVGTSLFVVKWGFYDGKGEAGNKFAAMHIVSAFGKFIVNDSAKGGMFGQLEKLTDRREELNPESAVMRTSTAGLAVPRGLKANNKFYFDTRPKSEKAGEQHFGRAIPNRELDDVVKYPMLHREESKQTWSFDL